LREVKQARGRLPGSYAPGGWFGFVDGPSDRSSSLTVGVDDQVDI